MIQYEYQSWRQPVPLPPLAPAEKPNEQDASPAGAAPAAALPPTGQSSPLPQVSQQDDDYQWLMLL